MVKTLCYTNTRDMNGRRKLEMEIHCVKPQILDHWNKVPISRLQNICKSQVSSIVRVFHSCQTNHIRQAGTIFQILEKCFPSQFLHPKRREATIFDISHWIPNIKKTSHHKAEAYLQLSKRWSIVSSSQWHKQHQLARDRPLRIRLPMVRILPQAVVHKIKKKKKDTLLGTFILQMLFQGKETVGGPDKIDKKL